MGGHAPPPSPASYAYGADVWKKVIWNEYLARVSGSCRAYSKFYLIQNSQAVKNRVRPWERLWWKKMWNPRWRPRNGCDGRLMVKILITTIQVNFVPRPSGTKFTWIVVIKIFTINLPSQPFLGRHLGFHIFFHHSLSQGRTLFFTAWLFWIRFHFFLYLYTPKPAYGRL